MKLGALVRIRTDRIIAEDSKTPLWGTKNLMDASTFTEVFTIGEITGWMTPEDTGVIIEVHPAGYTPIVRILVHRDGGGCGWLDSIYLREIK
jgi:hypothetical protein